AGHDHARDRLRRDVRPASELERHRDGLPHQAHAGRAARPSAERRDAPLARPGAVRVPPRRVPAPGLRDDADGARPRRGDDRRRGRRGGEPGDPRRAAVKAHPRLAGGLVVRSVSLVFGLFLYAVAIVLMLESRLGLSPWDVLHQGIARHTPLTFGLASVAVGVGVLLVAWALGGRPGIGTL